MKERQFDSVVESKKALEEMVETFGNVSDDTMERLEIVDEQLLKFRSASELYSKSKYSLRYWFGWEVDEVYEYGKFLYKFNADGVLVRLDKFADVYFNIATLSSSFLETLKEYAVPVNRKSYIIRHTILGAADNNYICINKYPSFNRIGDPDTLKYTSTKPYLGSIRNANLVRHKSIDEAKDFLKKYNLLPEDQYEILEEAKYSGSGRVKDYIIGDLDDAKDIVSKLMKRAMTHGVATIADYYDMVGIAVQEFADYEYGWAIRDIPRMEIKASNGGWYIDFPKVRSIQ